MGTTRVDTFRVLKFPILTVIVLAERDELMYKFTELIFASVKVPAINATVLIVVALR